MGTENRKVKLRYAKLSYALMLLLYSYRIYSFFFKGIRNIIEVLLIGFIFDGLLRKKSVRVIKYNLLFYFLKTSRCIIYENPI